MFFKKLYTEEDELPYKNEYSIVLDKEEIPVCIIKTDRVRIIPFYQADERHAQKEGEGDKTLSYFRKVHIDFFKEECEKANTFFSEDDLIVIEEFHLEYKNKNYVFSKWELYFSSKRDTIFLLSSYSWDKEESFLMM